MLDFMLAFMLGATALFVGTVAVLGAVITIYIFIKIFKGGHLP